MMRIVPIPPPHLSPFPAPPHALLCTLLLTLLVVPTAGARVLSIEVDRRVPILEGRPFEGGISYELIEGRVRFGFDPENPANTRVSDLAFAPRSPEALVEAWSEFVALQPIDPAQRSGTALVDVPNRGRRLILNTMNRVQTDFMGTATLDPEAETDWGDGFLMTRGLTILWVGWQADAPDFPGAMRLRVPRATEGHGDPVRGLARSDWVVDEATEHLALAAPGHAPHVAADPESPENRLTRRRGREAERQHIPRDAWRFDDARVGILTDGPFEAGWIYELVYLAEAPPLVGLGFAAFRDFAAYAENDPDCPFPVERSIAHGLSQSGRFLRHFLYEGFNLDEAGRRVFDAMMIQIGGAGRGGFNHRFSHPGRVGNPYANFFYPGDQFPFTSQKTESGNERAGLLDRARASGSMPKIFQINTGYEYWGRGASLIHMTTDGTRDVSPLDEERLYHLASAPHYSLPFPPDPRAEARPGLFLGSSLDTSSIQRALLVHLRAWLEDAVDPPPSTIPTIVEGTLVEPSALDYPMASLTGPRSPHVAYRIDYGPRWTQGIIDHQPPRRGEAFAIRVPQVDSLGSEATGIRALELRVPIGTYTPWALRLGKPGGSDEMAGYIGSFLPLALRPETRREGDRRPSLSMLYPTRDAYETSVVNEIDALVEAGWILPRDRAHVFTAAIARWNWITVPGLD
ncbi:MAG: hypothetical protein CL933_16285 [Deltaproteobacteria bacterium]|nr:hypothetical protein [Deltaproteobacteria bacterium]